MIACLLAGVTLALSVLGTIAAGVCAVMAYRLRRASQQAADTTRAAALLTSSIVARAAPWLDCEVCGDRLDTRAGVGIGLDGQGQLRLRCGEHMDREL